MTVSIQCSHLPEFDSEMMEPQPCRIDWSKVTAQEREDCYHGSKKLLDQLQLPTEAMHCHNFNCTDEKHLEEIKKLYRELTSALLVGTSSTFKTLGEKNAGKFNIFGWNSLVKSKHQTAKAAFWLWINCSKPKIGGIYKNMVKTKKQFKHSLRQCRKDVEIHKANGLAAALQADKTNQ